MHDLLFCGESIRPFPSKDAVQNVLANFPQRLPLQVVQVQVEEYLPTLPMPMVIMDHVGIGSARSWFMSTQRFDKRPRLISWQLNVTNDNAGLEQGCMPSVGYLLPCFRMVYGDLYVISCQCAVDIQHRPSDGICHSSQ